MLFVHSLKNLSLAVCADAGHHHAGKKHRGAFHIITSQTAYRLVIAGCLEKGKFNFARIT